MLLVSYLSSAIFYIFRCLELRIKLIGRKQPWQVNCGWSRLSCPAFHLDRVTGWLSALGIYAPPKICLNCVLRIEANFQYDLVISLLISNKIPITLEEGESSVTFPPTPGFCLESWPQHTPFVNSCKSVRIGGKVLGRIMNLQCVWKQEKQRGFTKVGPLCNWSSRQIPANLN